MHASLTIYTNDNLEFDFLLDQSAFKAHSLIIRHPGHTDSNVRQFLSEAQIRKLRDVCNRALTELEVDRITVEQAKAIEGQLAAVKAEAKTCPGCGTKLLMDGEHKLGMCHICATDDATFTEAKPMTAQEHNQYPNGRF